MSKYFFSFIVALALHIGIIGLFVINVTKEEHIANQPEKIPEIIEASILDETVVEAKAQELLEIEEERKRIQQQKIDNIAKQLKQEENRLQETRDQLLEEEKLAIEQAEQLKKSTQEEQKKLLAIQEKVALELKKQQEQEKKRLAEEKKRLAEEKKQAQEKKRKAEAKRKADEKRKAEAAKIKAERLLAEKKRKLADQKKKREKAEKQRNAAAQEAENARIAKQAFVNAVALIKRKVTQNWNPPNSATKKLSCRVNVSLIPSGDVMSVRVVKSSGDSLFDDSVERAVFKASPLPVPKDANVFKQFRNFTFVFAPG